MALIVCAKVAAFGRINEPRRAGKARARLKRERMLKHRISRDAKLMNGNVTHLNRAAAYGNGFAKRQDEDVIRDCSDTGRLDAAKSDDEYPSTTDSEIML